MKYTSQVHNEYRPARYFVLVDGCALGHRIRDYDHALAQSKIAGGLVTNESWLRRHNKKYDPFDPEDPDGAKLAANEKQ